MDPTLGVVSFLRTQDPGAVMKNACLEAFEAGASAAVGLV